jgi:hypothetical protein
VDPAAAARLQLDVSLLSCGGDGGAPVVVARGTAPLHSDWLANEVGGSWPAAAAQGWGPEAAPHRAAGRVRRLAERGCLPAAACAVALPQVDLLRNTAASAVAAAAAVGLAVPLLGGGAQAAASGASPAWLLGASARSSVSETLEVALFGTAPQTSGQGPAGAGPGRSGEGQEPGGMRLRLRLCLDVSQVGAAGALRDGGHASCGPLHG